jgi:hypothetical protein
MFVGMSNDCILLDLYNELLAKKREINGKGKKTKQNQLQGSRGKYGIPKLAK